MGVFIDLYPTKKGVFMKGVSDDSTAFVVVKVRVFKVDSAFFGTDTRAVTILDFHLYAIDPSKNVKAYSRKGDGVELILKNVVNPDTFQRERGADFGADSNTIDIVNLYVCDPDLAPCEYVQSGRAPRQGHSLKENRSL